MQLHWVRDLKRGHRIATEWLELEGLGNSEAQLILALDNEFEFIKNRSSTLCGRSLCSRICLREN